MATQYAFVTRWQIKAPLTQVWDVIHSSLEWPSWWKGVEKVELVEYWNLVGGLDDITDEADINKNVLPKVGGN